MLDCSPPDYLLCKKNKPISVQLSISSVSPIILRVFLLLLLILMPLQEKKTEVQREQAIWPELEIFLARSTLQEPVTLLGHSHVHPKATSKRMVLLHLPVQSKETMKIAKCS